jgi:nitrogen regulatory protein PII
MESDDADALAEDDLRELILIVRPEERWALERTLQAMCDTAFVSLSALGRGGSGGLRYRGRRSWFSRPSVATFLPKAVFYLTVPASEVEHVLAAVRGALRVESGPADAGLGLGLVLPLEIERAVEDTP